MTNFIEITFIHSSGMEFKELVNVSKIKNVYTAENDNTYIDVGFTSDVRIKESYDEIKNMLNVLDIKDLNIEPIKKILIERKIMMYSLNTNSVDKEAYNAIVKFIEFLNKIS